MELPEQDRQALIEAARRRGQGGAAFGVYPSSGKRPEKLNVSRDVNMPAQVARGWVAGTLGLPGDIEELGRLLLNVSPAGREHERSTGKSFVGETPALPTSDFYKEWLPGRDERPAAKFASGLGALTGGAGSTTLARGAVKGAKATGKALGPKAAEMAEGYLKKSGLAPELIAYHGTPHRFAPEEGAPLGKFRSEKIGTGEGAQAYGHGLYLAESPGVAESYRKALSDNVFTIGGKDIKGPASKYGQPAQNIIRSELSMPEKMATYALDSAIKAGSNKPAADAIKHLTKYGKGNPDVESALDMVRQWEQQGGKVEAGNLYTVDVPDEMIGKMLDWDKPISQQPKTFQNLVSDLPRFQDSYVASKTTAGEAYGELAGKLGSREKASEALRQAGIPGIRYLDRQSRPTNIMDKRLQGLFEKHNGDIEKTVNEYMRSIYDTPKVKEKIRADVMKQLEAPITRNFVIFPGEEESVKIIDRKAEGGLVEDTDAIAAKLTGMDKDKALTHALRMANAKQEAHMAAGGLAKLLKGAKAAEEATKAAKATEKVAEAAKPAVIGPQAKALETARKNAVKMLGLPETNTPQDRAKALGFTTDYLHGTQRMDRLLEKKSLDPRRATSGPMPFGTSTPELASGYAMQKVDTSLRAADEGDVTKYFEVAPKDLGLKGMKAQLPVEKAWHFMSPEQRAEIAKLAPRVGYENLDEFTGKFIVHPEGVNATLSPDQWDWIMKREAKGNPLAALREMWHDSGQLVDEPEQLGEIYRLAGVKAPISQSNAPWTEAKGVLLGKARITNPLDTANTEQVASVIEPLKQAFARDRSKTSHGPDQWAKQSRYTPKEWVEELERDLAQGKDSYVWTSIPDKVTEELKRLNFNGIIDRSGKGGGAKEPVIIPFEPEQVRSRFAAFDPARINEKDLLGAADPSLLAGTAVASGIGLGALGQMSKPKPEQEEKKKAAGGLAKRM